MAIRFPRFTGVWRDDKSPEEATTSKEIEELYSEGMIDDDEYDEIMQSIAEMRAELKEYYMLPPSLTEEE